MDDMEEGSRLRDAQISFITALFQYLSMSLSQAASDLRHSSRADRVVSQKESHLMTDTSFADSHRSDEA